MADQSLPSGFVLEQRFQIERVLGQGGFGIAYLALDLKRGDQAVVKELHPSGSQRGQDHYLQLPGEEAWVARLKRRFIEEARLASRLDGPGFVPIRSWFMALGTGYFVADFVHECANLEQHLATKGVLDNAQAQELMLELLDSLARVHSAGVLHRDVKPSNILLSPKRSFLIDFGAAREWMADRTDSHTLVFTPTFAPPEQMAERARRGPASDLFSLAATLYVAVSGVAPASAPARASGTPYVSIRELSPKLDPALAQAIDYCLRLKYAERPQNVESVLRVLHGESASDQSDDTVAVFDEKARRMQNFQFQKRQCPACGVGVLDRPRPLKPKQCPVCHAGFVRIRRVDPRLCPHCRQAPLVEHRNRFPAALCPVCCMAVMQKRKRGLIRGFEFAECPECEAAFHPSGTDWMCVCSGGKDIDPESARRQSAEDWIAESGRSLRFWLCTGCGAQYDEAEGGRRKQAVPAKVGKYDLLYPEEWANVAAGLPPHSGNGECDACGADYFVEGERATLLAFDDDPFQVSDAIHGRLLDWESLRWMGVGKESPNDGLVCGDCGSEFDLEGDLLELVRTSNLQLLDRAEKPRTIEDWIRIGERLPIREEIEQFETDFQNALREAYREGRIGPEFPRRRDLIWQGTAALGRFVDGEFEVEQESNLTITDEELVFGGMMRKKRFVMTELRSIRRTNDILEFEFEKEPVAFEFDRLEISFSMESGIRKIEIDAEDLEHRLLLPAKGS